MSCFKNLEWPWCNPDEARNIYECSDSLDPSVNCCLSTQTPDETVNNCLPGWESTGEWCTSNWNAFEEDEYRHKCKRIGGVECDNSSDNLNCGIEGACRPGTRCENSTCVLTCPTLYKACSGVCANITNDDLNCGGCDQPCDANKKCVNSVCSTRCGSSAFCNPETQLCVENTSCVTRGDFTVTLVSTTVVNPTQIIAYWSLGKYPINLNNDLVVVNIIGVDGGTENVRATYPNTSKTLYTWITTATLTNPLQPGKGYSITVTVMNEKVSNPNDFIYNPQNPIPLY
jgi:hypothetical protein